MIVVKIDNKQLHDRLSNMQSQIPFATSLAINRTAQQVKKGLISEMKSRFDRPTPFALNSLYITPGKKQNPEARVWFKDEWSVGSAGTPATKYLSPNVFSGARSAKSTEKMLRAKGILGSNQFTVPGKGAIELGLLDRFGNLQAGRISQMRSQLQVNRDLGHQSNRTEKSKRRNRGKDQFFVIGGKNRSPLGIGIRPKGGQSKTFLWFVKSPNYSARFDFIGKSEKLVAQHLPEQLSKAIEYAIRTAR